MILLADLDGTDGFRLDGVAAGDYAGMRVSGLGDINGDGLDDFAVSARSTDPGGVTDAGSVYVISAVRTRSAGDG